MYILSTNTTGNGLFSGGIITNNYTFSGATKRIDRFLASYLNIKCEINFKKELAVT